GVCDKNLARYARAVEIWNRQLREGASLLSSEEVETTRAAITAAEQFVSTVQITANVEGAVLLIDDETSGTTPFAAPVAIDVGRHVLRLRKQGYQDQTVEVTVAGGMAEQATFKLEPVLRTALVTVIVPGAPGASIFVDGTEMGPAPLKGELPVGRHTFEARAAGFVTARQTSDVVYQQPLDIILAMARERHEGKVRVRADEADAVITIDGKVVASGQWEGVLPAGGHQLTVRKPGFVTFTTDIALNHGQVRDVSVPMRMEEKGAAWVWWTAGTLAVVAGGAVAGYFVFRPTKETPVTGTWNPGLLPTRMY
ncbi:MAG: PEGA domain-containing protein, partial [Polyangiaceae bacterium]|nr:PEGA domain-containing protein [Polyangiaceae bacterium]